MQPHDQIIADYLAQTRQANSHPLKLHHLLTLLQGLFGITSADYQVEQNLPQSSRLRVRGKVDTVIGDLLIEVKVNLRAELADAEEQLRRYLASHHAASPLRPFLGIATDGIRFQAYRPRFQEGHALPLLEPVNALDLNRGEDQGRALLWLDAYLFRQVPRQPTELDFAFRFGPESPTYGVFHPELDHLWQRVAQEPSADLKFGIWQRHLTMVYGTEAAAQTDLFLRHTYLATLAKLLAACVFAGPASPSVEDVLGGTHFDGLGVHNFVEDDLFTWPLHPAIRAAFLPLAHRLLAQLQTFDPHGFTEDVLKGLYESLVDPQERHDLGEYYTPDWLADRMVRHTLNGQVAARILDPACGSGSFLIYAYQVLADFYRRMNQAILDEQTSLVTALAAPDMFQRLEQLQHLPQPVHDYPQVILREHLFGVDLDQEAAEIAAVNLTMQAFADSRQRKLPLILNENIKVGNSLISGGEAELRPYFGDAWKDKRPFTWEREFPEIMARGGFDVVIGNPPWASFSGREKKDIPENEYNFLAQTYTAFRGWPAIHSCFVQRAISLLRPEGYFSFIVPAQVASLPSYVHLRESILQDYQ